MEEISSYRDNIDNFFKSIDDAFIKCVVFDMDENPSFDKKLLPFKFKYCNAISFITDKGNFKLKTSMTSEGLDTFWVLPISQIDILPTSTEINSKVKNWRIETKYNKFAFKIIMKFEKTELFLFAGEIYETSSELLEYKLNDEMILAFETQKEAEVFENLAN
jgi:hypothetical protein